MSLTTSDVRWYKTYRGFVTSLVASGKLHDVTGSIRVGDNVRYVLVALVNDSATDALAACTVGFVGESGGVTITGAKSATGIVAKGLSLADTSSPDTLTYSNVTTGSPLTVGTLGAGQAIGIWLRLNPAGGTAKSPETLTLVVSGTAPI